MTFFLERITWRKVEVAIEVDPTPRSSWRDNASMKAKTTHATSSFKGKGKRLMTGAEENIWSSDLSDSPSNSDTTQFNSDHEE